MIVYDNRLAGKKSADAAVGLGQPLELRRMRKAFHGAHTVDVEDAVKMVDLVTQQTVHANTYTGAYREQRPISGMQFDNNIFQTLMKSALQQAADELYEKCAPGRMNTIRVTPIP